MPGRVVDTDLPRRGWLADSGVHETLPVREISSLPCWHIRCSATVSLVIKERLSIGAQYDPQRPQGRARDIKQRSHGWRSDGRCARGRSLVVASGGDARLVSRTAFARLDV
jgi:hypothetical protein